MITPAQAYWNQRHDLVKIKERFEKMGNAIGSLTDMNLYQWAQLAAMALEYQPDLILELGRRKGNSTCVFTESANMLAGIKSCKVVSLCLSNNFETQTLPKLRELGLIDDTWLTPLEHLQTDILLFDFEKLFADYNRILVFWDAHGFEVANCVLGRILPLLENKQHLVMMHDLSDQRYAGKESTQYNDQLLWSGKNNDGTRIILGHINSAVEQSVSIVDFASRNEIHLESADHTFHTEIEPDQAKHNEMQRLLGDKFYSLQGHWFYFSLNDYTGPFTFPRFRVTNK